MALTEPDGYGTEHITESAEVECAFEQHTGYSHANHQDAVGSDAVAVVNPLNSFIVDHSNRLEEMLVMAPLYGASDSETWYKVLSVEVGTDHQLTDQIDNIVINLKKTVEVPSVS
jgi:hypothetical protein